MFELRDFQARAVDDLRAGIMQGHTRQILGLATGSGKTVIASHIAMMARTRGRRVMFIVHLKALIWQAKKHLEMMGLSVGVMQGENTRYNRENDVIVASIHTVRRRQAPDWVHLIIIDEVHVLHKAHIELMQRWNNLPVVGLSATPERVDLGKYFTRLVRGPSYKDLTSSGYLVPAKAIHPDEDGMEALFAKCPIKNTVEGQEYDQVTMRKLLNTPKLVGDIGRTWLEHAKGRKTLAFAADKALSRAIVSEFEGLGVPAAHVEDMTPDTQRERIFRAFRRGDIRVISSVGVTAIGFDMPDADCVLMARKTLSVSLHIQMLGRGLRTMEGKSDCLILDFVGNVPNLGMPEDYEISDLGQQDKPDRGKRKKGEKKRAICHECDYAIPPEAIKCPECGADRSHLVRPAEYVSGGLIAHDSGKAVAQRDSKRKDYLMLLWYARERKWKDGWAYFAFEERHKNSKAPYSWRNEEPITPDASMANWITSYLIRQRYRRQRQKAA